MKTLVVVFAILAIVFAFSIACVPKAIPAVTPAAPPAPLTAPPATVPQLPSPSAEETAWAKIVSDARKEGRVTMYSWGFTGEVGQEVVAGFEKATGIKIELVGGIGAILLERLKTESAAGKYIADTYDTATPFLLQARAAGLVAPIKLLPELNGPAKWRAKPTEPDVFPYYVSMGVPYMNINLVKSGQEPKSYKDLLQPQWKGKIVMAPPGLDPTPLYPCGEKVWRRPPRR